MNSKDVRPFGTNIELQYQTHYLTPEEQKVKVQELLDAQADVDYMITITFLKDNMGWYALCENHTRDQNAMVLGADKLIEHWAKGDNRVDVKFRTVPERKGSQRKPIFWLRRFAHHPGGAEYLVHGVTPIPFPAFLCDVTHDVTGEHPKKIFVYDVTHSMYVPPTTKEKIKA